jgi:SAM-dependent methyltransferase
MALWQRLRRGDLRIVDRGPLAYTASSVVHYGLRAAVGKRVNRTKPRVMEEYDGDVRSEYVKPDMTYDELVFSTAEQQCWMLLDGRVTYGYLRAVRERHLELLARRIEEYTSDNDVVVEFGCGTGRNLFYLARRFPKLRLVGIELTPATVARARKMAERDGLRIEFIVGDMTQPVKLPAEASVAYSVHALEQLPGETSAAAVEQMLAVSRKATLFYEPVVELWDWSMRGVAGRFRNRNANYLRGLKGLLQRSPVNIVSARALGDAFNPFNETCEIVVTPRS